ncbi:MAG: hypothetical protein GY810_28160 [Aureispira sp.]|nr:hypothetical protein [Aureispira sp.]
MKIFDQDIKTSFLSISIKETSKEDLGQLEKFKRLTLLTLSDGKDLTELPPAVLKLSKLETLRIRGLGIKKLPDNLACLANLRELTIEDCPDISINKSISKLTKLSELKIINSNLSAFQEGITKLDNLTKLELQNNRLSELPDSIKNLKKVERINLSGNNLNSLPDGLCDLNALMSLNLSRNKLHSLPAKIKNLSNLLSIYLDNNSFKEFPMALCSLTGLCDLFLRSNKLKALPIELSKLNNLYNFYIEKNKFTAFPPVLFNWYSFSKAFILSFDKKLSNNKDILSFLQKKSFRALSSIEQQLCFDLFCYKKTVLKKMKLEHFYYGLNSRVPKVSENALEYLTAQQAPVFKKGDEVLILGKTSRKKSELSKQLKNCGLKYTTKIKDSTTHVLISARNNKGLDKLPSKVHWNWIIESDLINYLDKIQPSYLLEAESKTNLSQIEELIMTLKEENMALALELIEGGGLPKELQTEVFIVEEI